MRLPSLAGKLTASQPLRVFVEIVSGANVPPYAGVFASDPLWQPFASEPFVEIYICKTSDTDQPLQGLKKTQTKVDSSCAWNEKFLLKVPERSRTSELSLAVRLMDYRRFTEAVVVGRTELRLDAIPLHAEGEKKTENFPLQRAAQFFDVSSTSLEMRIYVPAVREGIEGDQVEEDEDVVVVENDDDLDHQTTTNHEDVAVQTDAVTETPIFTWTYDGGGHIPWIYEKWHKAISRSTHSK
jgi:hypothetical protein